MAWVRSRQYRRNLRIRTAIRHRARRETPIRAIRRAIELGTDAALREAGNADVTVRLVPEVNHLLLHDPDGSPAGYLMLPGRTVVPELLGALADWTADRLH